MMRAGRADSQNILVALYASSEKGAEEADYWGLQSKPPLKTEGMTSRRHKSESLHGTQ